MKVQGPSPTYQSGLPLLTEPHFQELLSLVFLHFLSFQTFYLGIIDI